MTWTQNNYVDICAMPSLPVTVPSYKKGLNGPGHKAPELQGTQAEADVNVLGQRVKGSHGDMPQYSKQFVTVCETGKPSRHITNHQRQLSLLSLRGR